MNLLFDFKLAVIFRTWLIPHCFNLSSNILSNFVDIKHVYCTMKRHTDRNIVQRTKQKTQRNLYQNRWFIAISFDRNSRSKQSNFFKILIPVGPGLAQLVERLAHRYSESKSSNPSNLTSATVCGDRTGCAPPAKRLASVAPEVDLGECTLHSPPQCE